MTKRRKLTDAEKTAAEQKYRAEKLQGVIGAKVMVKDYTDDQGEPVVAHFVTTERVVPKGHEPNKGPKR